MIGIIVETVVIAFIMGGIVGAVAALHLSSRQEEEPKKVPVPIDSDRNQRNY